MHNINQPRFRYGLLFWCLAVLLIFNVAFPKGGIKLGSFPLTWGYAIIGILGLMAFATFPLSRGPRLAPTIQFAVGFVPLAALTAIKGIYGNASATITAAWIVNFLILPLIVLMLFGRRAESLSDQQIAKIFTGCIRFVIVWGLFNFFLFAATKKVFDIAYLTVNVADYGNTFSKNNRRGTFMKLISTYNNGNIYGACMLMLAPLYLITERVRVWKMLYIVAIVLTISRTAWFGLLELLLVMSGFRLVKINRPSIWIAIMMAAVVVGYVTVQLGWGIDKVADTNLGNRVDNITMVDLSLFGESRIHIPELTYVGLLASFGVAGFLFALVAFFTPLVFAITNFQKLSLMQRAAAAGIGTYLAVAIVDGALIFPPVIVLFLFVSVMTYRHVQAPPA